MGYLTKCTENIIQCLLKRNILKSAVDGSLPTQAITQFHNSARLIVDQPRSQVLSPTRRETQPRSKVLSPTRRETLVESGHVSPRIWEITNKRFGGGADKCEICLCRVLMESAAMKLYLTLS